MRHYIISVWVPGDGDRVERISTECYVDAVKHARGLYDALPTGSLIMISDDRDEAAPAG